MATNLNAIAQFITARNWHYEIDPISNTVITSVHANQLGQFPINIHLKENGKYIQIVVPQIWNLRKNIFKGIIYQTLLQISYSKTLIRFANDSNYGELCASVELPLEDANLTQRLFDRCLDELVFFITVETIPRPSGKNTLERYRIRHLYRQLFDEYLATDFDFRHNAEALLAQATPEDLEWLRDQIQQCQ